MESFGKVQEESIQKIENLFHVVLPEDYTKFLLDFNGGVIANTEPGEVYLEDIAQFINIDVLYGIDTGKLECNIEYWTDKYFDDSYYFEESNDEGNVYWIAENFEEFWKMLKNY